jgi:hypothetical protein
MDPKNENSEKEMKFGVHGGWEIHWFFLTPLGFRFIALPTDETESSAVNGTGFPIRQLIASANCWSGITTRVFGLRPAPRIGPDTPTNIVNKIAFTISIG